MSTWKITHHFSKNFSAKLVQELFLSWSLIRSKTLAARHSIVQSNMSCCLWKLWVKSSLELSFNYHRHLLSLSLSLIAERRRLLDDGAISSQTSGDLPVSFALQGSSLLSCCCVIQISLAVLYLSQHVLWWSQVLKLYGSLNALPVHCWSL